MAAEIQIIRKTFYDKVGCITNEKHKIKSTMDFVRNKRDGNANAYGFKTMRSIY